jgi:hypothetical protein
LELKEKPGISFFFPKVYGVFKNGQKKCPKMKNENIFLKKNSSETIKYF